MTKNLDGPKVQEIIRRDLDTPSLQGDHEVGDDKGNEISPCREVFAFQGQGPPSPLGDQGVKTTRESKQIRAGLVSPLVETGKVFTTPCALRD